MSTIDGKYWDVSWNPFIGCTPISEACAHCWAQSLRDHFRQDGQPRFFDGPVFQLQALEKLRHWRKPRIIFVGDMTDIWHPDIPGGTRAGMYVAMHERPQHQYLLLTKRPDNIELIQYPKHWWIGATCETQVRVDERLRHLFRVRGNRWLSLEPLMGPVDILKCERPGRFDHSPYGWANWWSRNLHWVVIGCLRLNGNRFRGDEAQWWSWARDIVKQCRDARVPVWMKQGPYRGKVVTDMNLFPLECRIREYPKESNQP